MGHKDVGPTPARGRSRPGSVVPDTKKRRRRQPRGNTPVDPELQRLVREVGRRKVVPDTTAVERHYSRSLTIRRLVARFLSDNEGTVWADLPELNARAANEAGCAYQTAARWVYQFTRVGTPFALVEGLDHYTLERRG